MKRIIPIIIVLLILTLAALNLSANDSQDVSLPITSAPTVSYGNKVIAEISSRGSYGRLIIEDAKIDVALFYTKKLTDLQKYTDASDSAAMFDWKDGNTMIADHSTQGFSSLKNVKASSSTYAYIATEKGYKIYKCIDVISDGKNLGKTLAFSDGTAIGDVYTDKLIIYTCNTSDGSQVTITVWEIVKKNSKSEYSTYTVKRGDSAWSIAYKFLGSGERYGEIVKLNNLKTTTVETGQKLYIPKSGKS